ncbi:CU044_5270 family protein [Actinomadura harenae]|uniref:CU044_5270 family protein n=1 Tax=Actinomadura harenae TaxID=2483351 RepID=A0A3M2MCV8_9ACTN|nr:CU044_5270 family protein [Actinomadura harenae]RMI47372.1 hypothetical protein EBO15_02315 [Actinomadura harenae]
MKRDAMRMLMDARPDDLDPNAPVDPATRERELARARHGAHGGTTVTAPARRRVRPVWGIGVAGVAAAAVAAAVLVPTGGGDGGDAPPLSKHDAALQLTGRNALLTAAETADRQPAASGAYWRVSRVQCQFVRAGTGASAYTVASESRSEAWTPNDPAGSLVTRDQDLGAHPATNADKVLWRKAGSPTSWTLKLPAGGGHYKQMGLTAAPGKARTRQTPVRSGEVYWLGRNVTMKQVRELPADPKKLKSQLSKWYRGHGTEAEGQKSTRDEWLFDVARGLVTDMPVTPKVRAAAFRLLAGLPSVVSLGRVTDGQGRQGVAIGLTRPTTYGDLHQTRLIVDPSAGRGLGEEDVLVKASSSYPGVRAGTVLNSSLVTTEWTAVAPS